VGCEVVNGDESILVVCENGFGKRSYVEDFRQTNRGGVGVRSIVTSERNGNVVGALCVTDRDGMVMISTTGQTIRITMQGLRILGRNTQGVKLANLKENDYLVAIQKLENSEDQSSEESVDPDQESIPVVEAPEVEALEVEAPEITPELKE
jgi:DNA gyrase subunit A